MEILIITVVTVVLLLIAGIKIEVIAMFLPVAAAALVLSFFVYSMWEILTSKKTKGRFCRFERSGKYRFVTAVYTIDGKDYPGTFPRESTIGKLIYKKDKDATVFLVKSKDRVYDAVSCVTVILGLILGAATLIMTLALAVSLTDIRL